MASKESDTSTKVIGLFNFGEEVSWRDLNVKSGVPVANIATHIGIVIGFSMNTYDVIGTEPRNPFAPLSVPADALSRTGKTYSDDETMAIAAQAMNHGELVTEEVLEATARILQNFTQRPSPNQ